VGEKTHMSILGSRLRPPFLGTLALTGLLLLGGASVSIAIDPGDKAPRFSAPELLGQGRVTLEAYRGKVVFLDFWASWCGPCLTSIPLLDQLRAEFSDQGFAVVGINVDRDPQAARKFLKRKPVSYPSASDPEGRIPESFEVGTMPTSFLIDRNGVVHYVHQGFHRNDIAELRERIAALLRSDK